MHFLKHFFCFVLLDVLSSCTILKLNSLFFSDFSSYTSDPHNFLCSLRLVRSQVVMIFLTKIDKEDSTWSLVEKFVHGITYL